MSGAFICNETLSRFMKWVCPTTTIHGECWTWVGSKNAHGYGRFGINGKNYYAHRIAWQIKHGDIPDGMSVCHKCDRTSCVNPNHLFLGSQKDNLNDASTKGRTSRGSHRPKAKLREGQIKEIILLKSQGIKQKQIALKFGVGQATISRIVHRTKWKHV